MKTIAEIFKPKLGNFFLTIFLITWQYLSFYEEMGQKLMYNAAHYLLGGLSFIKWDDVFVRNSSLVFLWVLIAICIYAAFLSFEAVSVTLHNFSLKRKLADVEESLELLRKRKVRTLEAHFAFLAGIISFIILLIVVVPYVEGIRSLRLDLYLYGLQEEGYYPDFNSLGWKMLSFSLCVPVWYFLASLNVWLFTFSKKEKEREEILEEHYAVPVVEAESSEESAEVEK